MADLDDSQDSVSMVEVLEEEKQLEADANAVLGGSDDKHCTYPMGYLARQALYSCATCISSDKEPAGVCLACCLECHEGHDLFELYTKRNFCCDCGNKKFGDMKCKLVPEKDEINNKNSYNQNFRGAYCSCHRPYPDPEDEIEDEMIQCVACEDWYHGRHLKATVPDEYEEMTCSSCVQRCSFLKHYHQLQSLTSPGDVTKIQQSESLDPVDVGSKDIATEETSPNPTKVDASDGAGLSKGEAVSNGVNTPEALASSSHDQGTSSGLSQEPAINGASEQSSEVSTCDKDESAKKCKLEELRSNSVTPADCGSLFWKKSWREDLCSCSSCKDLYETHKIPFITDTSDTITMYEARGRNSQGGSTQYERGMEALSQMDRVQQVEVLHGFNDLKSELKDYLKKFADNGKVVREEDIKEFFSDLASKKRQRTDMSYFCK